MVHHVSSILPVQSSGTGLQEFEYPKLTHSRMIRLLYICPESVTSLPLRCKVEEVNIDKCSTRHRYKAISYFWGSEEPKSIIWINERRLEITANCFAALQRLREIEATYVWIDAICINQGDDEEKTSQISLMRDIYYFADEVTCWLGCSKVDPARRTIEDLAFALIKKLHGKPEKDLIGSLRSIEQLHDDEQGWRALAKILLHEWFERVWVYQEVIVAKRVKLLFHYYYQPYETVVKPAMSLWSYILDLQTRTAIRDPFENMREELFRVSQQFRARNIYDRNKRQLEGIDFQDVLIATQHLKFTDIYTYSTLNAIEESRSLELLSLAESSNRIAGNSWALPSWVPDWRVEVLKGKVPLQHSIYKAAFGFGLEKDNQHESSILEVNGILVDTVIPGSFSLDERKYTYGLADWESQFDEYPNRDHGYHAWVRTITADRNDKDTRRFSRLTNDIFQQYVGLSQLPRRPGEALAHLFEQTIYRTVKSRAFFISKSGYMGLGPLDTDTDDEICILRGSNVPFLLRKKANHYILVGECFVWGLMDDEAVKDVTDSDFITFRLE